MHQAPVAIILAVLRHFRGPALFRGPRPSSSPGAPFWPSGLTLRSSGLAYGKPLTLAVSLKKFMSQENNCNCRCYRLGCVCHHWQAYVKADA